MLNKSDKGNSMIRTVLYSKKTVRVGWLFGLLLIAQSCVANTWQRQIQDYEQAYIKALVEKKVSKLASYYGDDSRLMLIANPTIVGRDAALQYYQAFVERFDVKHYERTWVEHIELGHHIVVLGRFRATLLPSTSEAKAERNPLREWVLQGSVANVWFKNTKGELILQADAWNLDTWTDLKDRLHFANVPSQVSAFMPRVLPHLPENIEVSAYQALTELAVAYRDGRTMSAVYSDDGVLMPNYHPMVTGKPHIEAYWEKHIEDIPVLEKVQNRTDRLDSYDDYAIQYASHIVNWRSGDETGVNTGKHLRVWLRGEDGRFRIRMSISGYDD